jgi:RNA polymerase sigma factor (sigma-70 family)
MKCALSQHELEDLHAEGQMGLLAISPEKRPYNAYIHIALQTKIQSHAIALQKRGGGPFMGNWSGWDKTTSHEDVPFAELESAASMPSGQEQAIARADLALLMARLSPEDRGMLHARHVLEQPIKEIAQSMGLTHQAVYSRLKRAMAALKGRAKPQPRRKPYRKRAGKY